MQLANDGGNMEPMIMNGLKSPGAFPMESGLKNKTRFDGSKSSAFDVSKPKGIFQILSAFDVSKPRMNRIIKHNRLMILEKTDFNTGLLLNCPLPLMDQSIYRIYHVRKNKNKRDQTPMRIRDMEKIKIIGIWAAHTRKKNNL